MDLPAALADIDAHTTIDWRITGIVFASFAAIVGVLLLAGKLTQGRDSAAATVYRDYLGLAAIVLTMAGALCSLAAGLFVGIGHGEGDRAQVVAKYLRVEHDLIALEPPRFQDHGATVRVVTPVGELAWAVIGWDDTLTRSKTACPCPPTSRP